MELERIIKNLNETEHKSDSPSDYEIALTNAFRFLGYQAKTIGGKGDTDVLLTANIGNERYKVDVDGKTSKNEKIIERQISWPSLKDHKEKNNSDFIVVIGSDFAGGDLLKRAKEYKVGLLKTKELIEILKAHSKYPFTLLELKDLFAVPGLLSDQVNDLINQNKIRQDFLEKFNIIINEIEKLQNTNVGYFTLESLAGREKVNDLELELSDIKYIIQLLKISFINAIKEIEPNKFVFTLNKKDLANTFLQISLIIKDSSASTLLPDTTPTPTPNKKETVTKYFKWKIQEETIIATARREKPYEHYCPKTHFVTILSTIINAFNSKNIINTDTIFQMLINKELSPNRIFKGKAEEYKIRLTLGILELEDLIKWTGSLRPIEYMLSNSVKEIEEWKMRKFDTHANNGS